MSSDLPERGRLEALKPFVAEVTERFGALPLAVRDEDYALVQRSTMNTLLTTTPAGFQPGRYMVSIPLPEDGDLTQPMVVDESGRIDAGSLANVIEALRGSFEQARHTGLQITATTLGDLQPMGAPAATVSDRVGFKLRGFEGVPLSGPGLRPLDPNEMEVRDDGMHAVIGLASADASGVVQILREDWPAINFVVAPRVNLHVSTQRFGAGDAGGLELDIVPRFGSLAIDEIAHLRAHGRPAEARSAVSALSIEVAAQSARGGAALVIAYALMRAGVPHKVEAFVSDLQQDMPGSPDLAVLAGEAAALVGGARHREALDAFLTARRLGLPAASHGLNYLIERLRFYANGDAAAAARLGIGSREMEAAKAALNDVQPFGLACDFTSPVTCYSGKSPTEPDTKDLDREAFERAPGVFITLQEEK